MTPMPTTSTSTPAHAYTAIAKRHKDGSVLLSIADDRICKLNGVGALTWMTLEQSRDSLTVGEVVKREPLTEILSEKKFLGTRRTPASAPAGILSLDGTVARRHKQARRPPAVAGSNWRRPVILLAENRESVRLALKKVLEAAGMIRNRKLSSPSATY